MFQRFNHVRVTCIGIITLIAMLGFNHHFWTPNARGKFSMISSGTMTTLGEGTEEGSNPLAWFKI
jgi:hypothetical protein